MTEMTEVRPEVAAFVEAVRARLADLSEDEREELLGGLEADLTDLVGDSGIEALGDPIAYAAELRSAAGLEPQVRRARVLPVRPVATSLDRSRAAFDRLVDRPGLTAAWELVVTLRPAWWFLRAWAAVVLTWTILDRQNQIAILPVTGGSDARASLLLLVLFTVLSVQIGRGRIWPGQQRRTVDRVVLLIVNAVAVVVLPSAIDVQVTRGELYRYADSAVSYQSVPAPGVFDSEGEPVTNIFAYDAAGQPLTGVQLFDQSGRPVLLSPDISCCYEGASWPYPWFNGQTPLFNVFPRVFGVEPTMTDDGEYDWSKAPTTLAPPAPPMSAVPPAALPEPAPSSEPTAGASGAAGGGDQPEVGAGG